jgi:hypothetical protein
MRTTMTYQALVVGHADADGHIIAEQVRRNLASSGAFTVSVVVDPARTKDHKAWTHLDAIKEIDQAEYVFFVDLMFGPTTYADEARALTRFVHDRPAKRFFLIDHHPLPLQRLETAENLHVIYRRDVADCAIGPRSGMMVVAALCEKQPSEVANEVKKPAHEALAIGMKRDDLMMLAQDDARLHRLPRGRRPKDQPQSEVLRKLEQDAIELIAHQGRQRAGLSQPLVKGTAMAHDVDVGQQELSYDTGRHVLQRNVAPSPKDLGVIITLLEVAALSLTSSPGATFTLEQLVREAREIGGEGVDFDERDVKIVLLKQNFIEKAGKEFRLK